MSEENDHVKWLKNPSSLSTHSKLYEGKTVKDIRYYGNGEEIITFTDGTCLCYSVQEPESGDDLYTKTEEEFNFTTWRYREEGETERKIREKGEFTYDEAHAKIGMVVEKKGHGTTDVPIHSKGTVADIKLIGRWQDSGWGVTIKFEKLTLDFDKRMYADLLIEHGKPEATE